MAKADPKNPGYIRGAVKLYSEILNGPTNIPGMPTGIEWFENILNKWKKIYKRRRDWWKRQAFEDNYLQRKKWYEQGKIKKVLKNILGPSLPPVCIKGALTKNDRDEYVYTECKDDVKKELKSLLDKWIPANEKTTPPRHLETWAEEDLTNAPEFVREWIVPEISNPQYVNEVFIENGQNAWNNYHYDETMQLAIDKMVSKRVSPGHGGISQELWIAAPIAVRERERLIIEWILRNGYAPKALMTKEMTFLPKDDVVDGAIDYTQGLPPWRPITVQSALTTRIFTAVGGFIEARLPNNLFQHGFQRNKTVQDASLLTKLLFERAYERQESLFLVSKDCLKCYDRIPSWVMNYIYRKLGVPKIPRKLMLDFLQPGDIKVRTVYGWINVGKRAFGIGQGSVLAIRHIGFYMDLLHERQMKGNDPVIITHSQKNGGIKIAGTMFVDDALDIATTSSGIHDRAAVSNIFTGVTGTGGVFGAEKSFMAYYDPKSRHHEAVKLNDGMSNPKTVTIVAPQTRFKHLGVMQSSTDLWESTISKTWKKILSEATRMKKRKITHKEFRYIVNHIWITRIRYKLVLSTSINVATHFDILIRNVARSVLRLPYNTPTEQYTNNEYGFGLLSCQDDVEIHRIQLLMRVLISPHIPIYHVLVEILELYQCNAGITENPLSDPIRPPKTVNTWIANVIRSAAKQSPKLKILTNWTNPSICSPNRINDRPILKAIPEHIKEIIIRINWKNKGQIKYIGDISNDSGKKVLTADQIKNRLGLTKTQFALYKRIEKTIHDHICKPNSTELTAYVGRKILHHNHISTHTRIPNGSWFVASRCSIENNELVNNGYDVGIRANNEYKNNGQGREINVVWWQELHPGSDIWYAPWRRTRKWEYEDILEEIEPTFITARNPSFNQLIVWEDTRVGNTSGTNNRDKLDMAFSNCRKRYINAQQGHIVRSVDRSCFYCKRYGCEHCCKCGKWHHNECINYECTATSHLKQDITAKGWFMYRWDTALNHHHSNDSMAGDGSVLNGGTGQAQGGWGLVNDEQVLQGRLNIHPRNITSTRCELHSLIMGLASSNDMGTQICDNTAAIHILQQMRLMSTKVYPNNIKYNDKHRIEKKTILKLLHVNGTFEGQWVKSHQENNDSGDPLLNAQRKQLAKADSLANSAHSALMTTSYSHLLALDDWIIPDDQGNIVVGKIVKYLQHKWNVNKLNKWKEKQHNKSPNEVTLYDNPLPMSTILKWDIQQKRLYWRAVAGTLHTNAKKHKLNPSWSSLCRLCNDDSINDNSENRNVWSDTQAHRFALTSPVCNVNKTNVEKKNIQIEKSVNQLLTPDQEIYIPGCGEYYACKYTNGNSKKMRHLWESHPGPIAQWSPMCQLISGVWAHGSVVSMLTTTRPASLHYVGHILGKEKDMMKRIKGGHYVPFTIQHMIQQITTTISLYDIVPSQWLPGWSGAYIDQSIPVVPALLNIPIQSVDDHHRWYIDTIFRARSPSWWQNTAQLIKMQLSLYDDTFWWILCYTGTKDANFATKLGTEWILRIPACELRVRTDLHSLELRQATWPQVFSTNRTPIQIGYITSKANMKDPAVYEIMQYFNIRTGMRYQKQWIPEHIIPHPPDVPRWNYYQPLTSQLLPFTPPPHPHHHYYPPPFCNPYAINTLNYTTSHLANKCSPP